MLNHCHPARALAAEDGSLVEPTIEEELR